jgi:hypothetical protein
MMNAAKIEKLIRISLGALLLLLALNAFGGGYYGLAGAKMVPVEWLEGSPFKTYFIPSLFLFVVIGGSASLAAILVLMRHPHAQKVAFACAFIVIAWLITQMAIIGYVSWMQPVTAIVVLLILLLTLKYKSYDH